MSEEPTPQPQDPQAADEVVRAIESQPDPSEIPVPTGEPEGEPLTPTPEAPAAEASPVVGLEAPAEAMADVTVTRPVREAAKPDAGGFVWGTGRRKAAVARVRIRPAKDPARSVYQINGREVDEFFTEVRDREMVRKPLNVTHTPDKLDIYVNVSGGGFAGQAGAVSLGLSRALLGYDPTLEPILREHELMTRDPRKVERKKPGRPGARRRFQFSKR